MSKCICSNSFQITIADELRRDSESVYKKYTIAELYTNISDVSCA